jgi:hypothetical protein
MSRSPALLAFGFAGALALVAAPAAAQHHRGGGASRGHAVSRSSRPGASRSESARPAAPRTAGPRTAGPRYERPRSVGPRYASPRYVGPRYVSPRYIGPRIVTVAPARFYRPYYAFRPRLSIGFGLWAGYPVPYAYPYYDPFYYPAYPYSAYPAYPAAPAPPPASVDVQPGAADTGGLSFEITPADAQIFVDGAYVGTVGQFMPTTQQLGLAAGRHRIEIREAGYQTIAFDVDIVAGEVIPYQGTMQR